jgi:hypothetical protein
VTWIVQDSPGGVHVIPVGDDLDHEERTDCACQPKVVMVDAPGRITEKVIPTMDRGQPGHIVHEVLTQRVRLLITHSAWDGRSE